MANFLTWDHATLEQFAQEATDKLISGCFTAVDMADNAAKAFREGAKSAIPEGLVDILNETSQILSEISGEGPPSMRWPIIDELAGYAAMISHSTKTKEQ